MKRRLPKRSPLEKVDFLVLLTAPIIAVFVSLAFKANFLTSTLLFYGTLAVYFSFRTPGGIKRALIFTLIADIFSFFVADYLAVSDLSWYVPTTIFPFRIYGILAIEDFIWGILTAYTVLIVYEHFVDKGSHKLVGSHLKTLVGILATIAGLFFLGGALNGSFIKIPYVYLLGGLFGILMPTVVILAVYPKFIGSMIKVGTYFLIVNFLHELTALELHQWTFPGVHFLGWVEVIGHRFPLEEFVYFIFLTPVALLCYFEYFDDDRHVLTLKK